MPDEKRGENACDLNKLECFQMEEGLAKKDHYSFINETDETFRFHN